MTETLLPDDPILALALRLTDGEAIDWKAESENGSVDLSLLRILKQIEAVARTHEGVETPTQGNDAAAPSNVGGPLWGHLEIIEQIGSGSSGDVYRARDTRLGRDVALKLLRTRGAPINSASTSLVREGHLLSRVRHPNVVTVYGADCIDGRTGLWMELIEGKTLEQEVQRRGALAPSEVAQIGAVLCDALEAVHTAGLVHRDVKAQNVMRDHAGRLVLMDFGSGLDAQRFVGSTIEGTPLYAAPEVLNGAEASVSSDIYSLGVLLWYLLTSNYPVNGRSVDEIRRAHARRQELDHDRSAGLVARIACQCVATDPRKRPPTVTELRRRLSGTNQHRGLRRRPIRNAVALGAFAAGILLLATAPLNLSFTAEGGALVANGEPVWLDSDGLPFGAPSADGRYFGCGLPEVPVAVCDMSAGIVRRIPIAAEDRWPATRPLISPDGRRIVYRALASNEVKIVDLSTLTSKTLTVRSSLRLSIIAWRASGDSLLIVMSPLKGGNASVALLEINSGKLTILRSLETMPGGVALSGNGRHLAFTQHGDLYIADVMTGARSSIAGGSNVQDAVVWTRNDDGVLFTTSAPNTHGAELRLVRVVDGLPISEAELLRHSGRKIYLHGISETGDIFYGSAGPQPITLYIAPFDKRTQQIGPPTTVATLESRLAIDWSPDSSAIAYGGLDNGRPRAPTIVIRNIQTAVERQVKLPGDDSWYPHANLIGLIRWSIGRKIFADTYFNHYLVDLDQTSVKGIETPDCFAGTGFPTMTSSTSYSIEWTPDGSTVLCASTGLVSGFDGATGAPTESHIFRDIRTSWVEVSAQQRLVAFSKPVNGKFEINIAALDDSVPRTVLVIGRPCRPVGWWNRELFVACHDSQLPNSSPLYLLDVASHATKAIHVNLRRIEHVRVRPDDGAIAITAGRTVAGTFVLKAPSR